MISCDQSGIYYPSSAISVFMMLLQAFCVEPLLTRSVAMVFLSPEEAGNSGGRHASTPIQT